MTNMTNLTAYHIDPNLDLEKVRRDCLAMAKSRAKISAGVAIIPILFLDVAVDVGMLLKLLPEINERFGLKDVAELSEATRQKNIKDKALAVGELVVARGVVNNAVRGFTGRIIGKQVSKFVPLGGQIVAASLGYMIFKKIATDHIEQCYKIAKEAQQKARADLK